MFIKIRYQFWLYDNTFPELILLETGHDPERYYKIKHDLSQTEYDERVRYVEPIPGMFIEGVDASKLARSVLLKLDLPEEEAEEIFTDNSLFELNEFYSILNNLIDKLWQIKKTIKS
jgi:regulator of RNase E activity RraB